MKEKERDLLDRALAGQPPEVKARVLDIVLRLGLDPTDDLFVVMIAFGFLQVLLEEYPGTLTELFDEFRRDIDTWTNQHLSILDSLAAKAKTEESLALNSISLLEGLQRLTDICSTLTKQLPTSPTVSPSSTTSSPDWRGMDSWASILRQDMQSQGRQILTLLDQQNRQLSQNARLVQRLWAVIVIQGFLLGGLILLLLKN